VRQLTRAQEDARLPYLPAVQIRRLRQRQRSDAAGSTERNTALDDRLAARPGTRPACTHGGLREVQRQSLHRAFSPNGPSELSQH